MKVLFICSGNATFNTLSPFIKAQAESLESDGVVVDFFYIRGKGIRNYLKNVPILRKEIKSNNYDLLHAHYALCGWVAVLTLTRLPIILSLMGSDVFGDINEKGKRKFKSNLFVLLTRFVQPFVDVVIVKSAGMRAKVVKRKEVYAIPNGIRMDKFRPLNYDARTKLGLDPNKQYVLFLANPEDPNKNIQLVQNAVQLLDRPDLEFINIYKVSHETIVDYLNAVDVFTLCSYSEGSPNVVKEAMSCNCPMVVTPAGDAPWVIGDTPGCYVGPYDAEGYSEKLAEALKYAETQGRTKGRARIYDLGLDGKHVAQQLESIYVHVISEDESEERAHQREPISMS